MPGKQPFIAQYRIKILNLKTVSHYIFNVGKNPVDKTNLKLS